MGNNYLIHLLKFEIGPFRMLNLANDFGGFLCCFPSYFILAYPKISSYFGGTADSDKAKVELPSGSLENQSIEDILALVSESRTDRAQIQEQKFKSLNGAYKPLSTAVDLSGFGMLSGSLIYMALLLKRKGRL
jgi:hypothetical protein